MTLRELLHWIYLMARAADQVLAPIFEPSEGGDEAADDGDEMKPERIQLWRLILKLALAVFDEVAKGTGKSRGSGSESAEKVAE
jgi:hypothetical protein